MSRIDKGLAVILIAVVLFFGVFQLRSNDVCADSDAAAERVIVRHYGEQLQEKSIQILAETTLFGGGETIYRIKGFQTANRSQIGLAIFQEMGQGRLKLTGCSIRPWAPVFLSNNVALYDTAKQSYKTYDLFLVLDERVRSIEQKRYISEDEPLPPGTEDGLQAPCITAFAWPEPDFAYHQGGYIYYDGAGNLLGQM